MKEVISIHIGGAGCRVGSAVWELLCLEHGIQPDGQMPSDKSIGGGDDVFNNFFSETGAGKHVPRCVFVDTDPETINEIATGTYRQLFHPEQLITDKSSGRPTGNYLTAYKNTDLVNLTMDRIKKLSDNCTDFDGFIIYSAVGGGTGSGLGAAILEKLSVDYPGKTKIGFNIYPEISVRDVNPLTAYNSILSTKSIVDHLDLSIVLDNQAIIDICKNNLGITNPTMTSINRLIAQVVSATTGSLRFINNTGFSDLRNIVTNLVPMSPLKLIIPSYAPIKSSDLAPITPTVLDICGTVLQTNNQFVTSISRTVKYYGYNLIYRGNCTPKDINNASKLVTSTITLSNKSSGGYTLYLYQPATVVPGGDLIGSDRSVLKLANTSAVVDVFERFEHLLNPINEINTSPNRDLSSFSNNMDTRIYSRQPPSSNSIIQSYLDGVLFEDAVNTTTYTIRAYNSEDVTVDAAYMLFKADTEAAAVAAVAAVSASNNICAASVDPVAAAMARLSAEPSDEDRALIKQNAAAATTAAAAAAEKPDDTELAAMALTAAIAAAEVHTMAITKAAEVAALLRDTDLANAATEATKAAEAAAEAALVDAKDALELADVAETAAAEAVAAVAARDKAAFVAFRDRSILLKAADAARIAAAANPTDVMLAVAFSVVSIFADAAYTRAGNAGRAGTTAREAARRAAILASNKGTV